MNPGAPIEARWWPEGDSPGTGPLLADEREMGLVGGDGGGVDALVAAQGAVEVGEVGRAGEAGGHQRALGGVEGALGVQYVEEAGDAVAVARLVQGVAVAGGGDEAGLGAELGPDRAAAGERVGDFPEGGLDGLLVAGDEQLPLGLGILEVAA